MIFDAIVLIAVLMSALIAFLRGFIRELLTIVGVAGGVIASFLGGPYLLPLVNAWLHVPADHDKVTKLFGVIPMDMVAAICAYGFVFIVVVIILSVLSYFLASGAKAIGLGPVDRALGFVFGVARAALLLSLLYLPVYKFAAVKERDQWFHGSLTRPYVERGADWIASLMPESTEKNVEIKGKNAKEQVKDTQEKLQQMDILKGAADKAGAAIDTAKEKMKDLNKESPSSDKEGYKPDQRKDFNQLIQKNQ